VDSVGNVYVSDAIYNIIRKITPDGIVSTLAGIPTANPNPSLAISAKNGMGNSATFNYPQGIVVDDTGNIYVADSQNNLIRKITPSGLVSTFAGTGKADSTNGPTSTASFSGPSGIALDKSGNIYVADYWNNQIRKINTEGIVSTLAGSGLNGFGYGSADGFGNQASFHFPTALTVDLSGNVYVADLRNSLIRKITPEGLVSTIAGGITTGTNLSVGLPVGITVDTEGNLYVTSGELIRKITSSGIVTNYAGSTAIGSTNGIGANASFCNPTGITVGPHGNGNILYISDCGNNLIRKITN